MDEAPRVWVVASHRTLENEHGHPQQYTVVDEVGTRTLLNLGMQPLSYLRVPPGRIDRLLDGVDGVLLGGSATDVDPRHFGEDPANPDREHDAMREAVSLPLVRACIARRIPLIGICRGSHEFNVALGGSLHQSLQALDRGVVHWEDPAEPIEAQYDERHAVTLLPGGRLAAMAGAQRLDVSSLHSQGVKRLGDGLVAEAHADDGLVEAFRWHDPGQFAWGFQFHPEFNHDRHAHYGRIMAAFVDACRARQVERFRAPEAPRGDR